MVVGLCFPTFCVLSNNVWIFLACVYQSFADVGLCFSTFHDSSTNVWTLKHVSIDLSQSLDSAFSLSICGSSTNAWIFFLACLSIFHDRWTLLSHFMFVMWAAWPVCWPCVVIYFLFVGLATAGTLSGLAPGAVTSSSSKVKVGFAPGGISHLYAQWKTLYAWLYSLTWPSFYGIYTVLCVHSSSEMLLYI